MIIELFGPPAAGKTTLAHALATALEKNGFDIQLIVSSRPAERGSIQVESTRALSWCRTALAAPLSRAAKLVSAGPVLLAGARSDELTASLMDLLPPRTLLWSVRLSPISFLAISLLEMAGTSDRIVIFDQGFLTALCSMALLARSRRSKHDCARTGADPASEPSHSPRRAPGNTGGSPSRAARPPRCVERLFEFDLQTSLRQIETTNDVARTLQEQGGRMMHVSSLDRRLLEKAVDRIVRASEVLGRKGRSRSIDHL